MSSKDYESEYELLQPWSAFILKTVSDPEAPGELASEPPEPPAPTVKS